MKAHTVLLAFTLSASVLVLAQAPVRAGKESTTSPSAQATPNQPGDVSAPSGPENQNAGLLQSQIQNALRNEPSLSNSHIVVNVTAEGIDLSGTVGSSKDRQAAERIAQSFDGNRKLTDNLMITGNGHSDLPPDHSAMNNSGTGNTKNPATGQSNTGTDAPPHPPPQK